MDGFGKLMQDADSNDKSYEGSLHNLRRFRWYGSRLIPEVQRGQGKFGPRSKPCMIIGYPHHSKTLWRIWDPHFNKVKAQSEVVCDEERNAYMLCQYENTDIYSFGFPEDEEYADSIDTGDEPLRIKYTGDEPVRGENSQTTPIGMRSRSHKYKAPDVEAEIAHSRPLYREDETAQSFSPDAENIAHGWHLHREDQTARLLAAAIQKLCHLQPVSPATAPAPAPAPPIGSHVTRCQGKACADALMVSEDSGHPYTYEKAMDSPQQDHWKSTMEEESTSMLLNNTFSALNSREARQLQLKPIGPMWVYQTKYNPDRSTLYKAWRVVTGYKQTDFGDTYTRGDLLTAF